MYRCQLIFILLYIVHIFAKTQVHCLFKINMFRLRSFLANKCAVSTSKPLSTHQRSKLHFSNIRKRRQSAQLLRSNAAADDDMPEWFRNMEENAANDPELAALLQATGRDPAALEGRMRSEMDALHARITGKTGTGEVAPPEITFRTVDPFDLWIWIELYAPPSPAALEMTQEVINSWFMLGRLGAYNSSNLQVLYSGSGMGERLEYDVDEASSGGLASSMHDMAALEANGSWLRFWVDMGTSDELAVDVLINALLAFSREHVGVRQIVVGGENEDWRPPEREEMQEVSMDPYSF